MTEQVGRLLEDKEGFDVSLSVGGETIEAHRFVLAMRSPIFRAELYGPMMESRTGQSITIEDIQPAVFRVLLRFIYTDSLPDNVNTEMIRLLLEAADRYAMERLKLVCQSIMCEGLDADTVATMLGLADQHNCDKLKDACFEYIEMLDNMDVVVATEGFKDLMVTCPALVMDALEKRRKFREA
jgi:speckle-type POZ protein